MWKVWNGPSIVCNGGCTTVKAKSYGELPLDTPLGLICGSEDFFSTKNPSLVKKLFSDWPSSVIHYHSDVDDHGVQSYPYIIKDMIKLVTNPKYRRNNFRHVKESHFWVKEKEYDEFYAL